MAFYSQVFVVLFFISFPFLSYGEISEVVSKKIKTVNARGEHYGLVAAREEDLNVLLANGLFQPYTPITSLQLSARVFHVGNVEGRKTIVVLSGRGSVNAAQTTQLLLTHFRVKAVIEYGRAFSANPKYLTIGDVAIPSKFAHTGVWYWESFGGDEGNYDRGIANLTFSNYNVEKDVANKLQTIYFQPETVYTVKGMTEVGNAKFWFDVDEGLFATAEKIEDVELVKCVGRSLRCLENKPKIKRVEKGCSANFQMNNVHYRDFVHAQLNVTSLDTESAAMAMVCESEKKAFLVMKSIVGYAGGPSQGNDVSLIETLWSSHARTCIKAIFRELVAEDSNIRSITGVKGW